MQGQKRFFYAVRAEPIKGDSSRINQSHVRGIGQGEARHRKYKRLKLGGGQAYDSYRCSISISISG
jgi:hypothetical protein